MPKVLYCNAVEASHNREAFCLVFRFQAPDGHQESVYISISPAGAKITVDLINKEIADYEKETAPTVAPWGTVEPNFGRPPERNHLST